MLSKYLPTYADPFLPVQLSPILIPPYLASCLLHGPHCYPVIPRVFLATLLFLPPPRPVFFHLPPLLFQKPFYQPHYCLILSDVSLILQPQLLLASLAVSLVFQPLFHLGHLSFHLTHPKVLRLFLILTHRTDYFTKLSDPNIYLQHSILLQQF